MLYWCEFISLFVKKTWKKCMNKVGTQIRKFVKPDLKN